MMNLQSFQLFFALFGLYGIALYATHSANEVIYITAGYMVLLTLVKLYLDKGVYLSLFYLTIVGYFYYIFRELLFYNPMLREFREGEITAAVTIISVGASIISTMLACNVTHYARYKNKKNTEKFTVKKWITLSIFVFYVGIMAIPAYQTLSIGRSGVWETSFAQINIIIPFLNAMGIILPAFIHLSFKNSTWIKFGLIILVFLIQIGIGNRFIILFSFFIYASLLVDFRKLGVKNIILPILILGAVSLVMSQTRGGGGVETIKVSDSSKSSEGIVYYFSGMVRYYDNNPHSYLPVYSTFSTYFLIPRLIWPDKPELIGSWILDTGVFITRFGDGHSGSVSFVGPFFADFGLLYVLPLWCLGIILVRLDKNMMKHIGEHSFLGIVSASFVPLVFFGYRSFNTSVATEIIIILMVYAVSRSNHIKVNN